MGSPSRTLFFILLLFFLSTKTEQSLIIPLTHSLSTTHHHLTTSPLHLIKSTLARSISRHNHHRHRHHRQTNHLSLPLSSGSDYTLTFTLHSQHLSLYMDTGSDLVWSPCSPFECILCEDKTPPKPNSLPPPLNISSSSLLTCQSPTCSAAHASSPSKDLCAIAHCPLDQIETEDCQHHSCPPFYYAYGDGSLIAKLHTETLHMGSSDNPISIKNFTFGCAHTTYSEPIGVAGFGPGVLSFPNQLARVSPQLGNQFSYCLISHSFDSNRIRRPSPLILGQSKRKKGQNFQKDGKRRRTTTVFTPMLNNPKHPYFYSVGLEAVSVGATRIPAPVSLRRVDKRGNGGVVVDSGTTYTMLPTEFYELLAGEVDKQLGKVFERAEETESRTGLRHCYYVGGKSSSSSTVLPGLSLHFVGNSTVVLPRRNWFYEFKDGEKKQRKRMVGCLMVMDAGVEDEEDAGPGATLGNYQQQGFEVVYDLENRRVGFGRRKCDDMWEELA